MRPWASLTRRRLWARPNWLRRARNLPPRHACGRLTRPSLITLRRDTGLRCMRWLRCGCCLRCSRPLWNRCRCWRLRRGGCFRQRRRLHGRILTTTILMAESIRVGQSGFGSSLCKSHGLLCLAQCISRARFTRRVELRLRQSALLNLRHRANLIEQAQHLQLGRSRGGA